MTRELFNEKVLPCVLLPTLDRAGRKRRFYKGENNAHAITPCSFGGMTSSSFPSAHHST